MAYNINENVLLYTALQHFFREREKEEKTEGIGWEHGL